MEVKTIIDECEHLQLQLTEAEDLAISKTLNTIDTLFHLNVGNDYEKQLIEKLRNDLLQFKTSLQFKILHK